jgi:hypothetical protein
VTNNDRSAGEIRDIVIRLDERTARMEADMKSLRDTVVTQPEFKPIRLIVYGLVAILLTGVVGAMLSQVVTKGP